MKIISQTGDEMVLKQGDLSGIIGGIVLALAGIVWIVWIWTISSGWTGLCWPGVFIFVLGTVILFGGSAVTLTINKQTNQIGYGKKYLIGSSAKTYALGDVLRVETRQQWRREMERPANGAAQAAYREVLFIQSFILFKNGKALAIDSSRQQSSMGIGIGSIVGKLTTDKEAAMASAIATFMGVPFQEVAPPGGPMNIGIGGGTGIQL